MPDPTGSPSPVAMMHGEHSPSGMREPVDSKLRLPAWTLQPDISPALVLCPCGKPGVSLPPWEWQPVLSVSGPHTFMEDPAESKRLLASLTLVLSSETPQLVSGGDPPACPPPACFHIVGLMSEAQAVSTVAWTRCGVWAGAGA